MRSFRKLLVTGIALLLLMPTAAAQRGSVETHLVRPGETLSRIAQLYGVEMIQLAAENGIGNAHVIHSWQLLTIPTSAPLPFIDAPARDVHIVQPGDTLGSIAAFHGVDLYALQALNNIYNGRIYPGYELLLPGPERENFAAVPAPDSAPAASGLIHIVRSGDTLGEIAQAYGVSLYDLQAINGQWSWWIYAGQELAIPPGGTLTGAEEAPLAAVNDEATPPPVQEAPVAGDILHSVQFGETLSEIAQAYGVSLPDLQALNALPSALIYPGQQLAIPAGGSAPVSEAAPVSETTPALEDAPQETEPTFESAPAARPDVHIVQRGETIFRIARRYGTSVEYLMKANNIEDPTRIHAGNRLRIAGPAANASALPPAANTASSPAPAPEPAPAPTLNREHYVVQRGDFLTQLGINLDTSWIALAKLNNLASPYYLHVGSTLLIPTRADVEKYDPEYAAWKWFDMIAHQPGPRVGVGREIVVVLGTQTAYAYENGLLQKAVRVSTGKKATPTIQGDHNVWLKRRSQTMSGPGYSLDNVEWVMYFYKDYAMHGAWWHMNFGQPMSRGCINMNNADAQWFYQFSEIGTPVYVRY